MVGSALAFALMSAGLKMASREVPTTMLVFFRNVVALGLLWPWVSRQRGVGLATRHLRGHLVRGISGLAAMTCFFFTLGRLRLADATLLNQSYPLFLPIIERAWLGERVPSRAWRSLALGFLGVLFILKPGSSVFSAVALVGLLSALFAAIAQVGIRQLTYTEPVVRIVFYFGLIATVGSALAVPWGWKTPSPPTFAWLVAAGALATAGQLSLTRAYVHAPAATVGPFIYTGVVFAALVDWLVWDTLPDRWLIPGALLVVAAGAAMLRREPVEPL
jgi:drug/metabolite transporter (DMT)-like permease